MSDEQPQKEKTRRQKSTGSQRCLPSGRWEVRETRGGKTLSRTGATVTEARGRLRDAWRDVDRGARNLGTATFGPYALAWLGTVTPNLAPYTVVKYTSTVREHLVPEFGPRKLTAITHSDVARWLVRLARTRRAGTLAGYRAVLVMICEAAVRDGLIVTNPARGAAIPRTAPPPRAAHRLTADETRRLLTASRSHPLLALWTLAAASGMRLGELLGLRWQDVDFDAGRVHVRVQLQRGGGAWVLRPLKTRGSTRTFALAPLVRDALLAHRVAQERDRGAAAAFWDGAFPLVFVGAYGGPLWQSWVRAQLHALCDAAGVPHIGPHALRHHVATTLGEENIPVHEAMALLGHSSPHMTRHYQHERESGRDRVATTMQAVLAPTTAPPHKGRFRRIGERKREG